MASWKRPVSNPFPLRTFREVWFPARLKPFPCVNQNPSAASWALALEIPHDYAQQFFEASYDYSKRGITSSSNQTWTKLRLP